jgi:beta-lactam-binding protein with PASTA domain
VVGTVTQQYSLTVLVGDVISQSVAAGTSVLPGAVVDLVISKGAIAVPDVVGQPQSAASTALMRVGLVVGTITQQYSATVPVGAVISQTPAAGTSVLPATAVALVISRGVQPSVMPDVVGQPRAQAGTAIGGAGLALGLVARAHSTEVVSGSVVLQSPAAGTELPPGTVVSIVVSLGPAPAAEGEGEPVNTDTALGRLSAAYESADTNGDGTLSFGESSVAVTGLTQAVFNELDANDDGQLDAAELGVDQGAGCTGCRGGKGGFTPADYGKRLGGLFLEVLGALGLAMMSTLRRP